MLTALPTHALENPYWLENLDGLLALAASFLFDDRSHVAHLGPSEAAEADPDAFLAAGGASPNAPWVSCVGAGGSWDDAPLVTPLLQSRPSASAWRPNRRAGRATRAATAAAHPRVRAAWVAHCDGAGDRARKAGKKRLSLTPRPSTAAAPAAAAAHDDGGEAEAADGGGAGAADGAARRGARRARRRRVGAGAAAARSHHR